MLKRLRISNYALIDNVEISFENGMTSITGETGAGKSILLGGLSLVLGSRVDNTKIINKDKKCFVEATFDLNGQNLEVFFSNQIFFLFHHVNLHYLNLKENILQMDNLSDNRKRSWSHLYS